MIPETAAASATTANKIAGGGWVLSMAGWLSDATTIALIGLAITCLGGIWSFLSWLQSRRDKKAERAEKAAEHQLRMKLLTAELLAVERGGK